MWLIRLWWCNTFLVQFLFSAVRLRPSWNQILTKQNYHKDFRDTTFWGEKKNHKNTRKERNVFICICAMYKILYATLWETASEESQTVPTREWKGIAVTNIQTGKAGCTLVASAGDACDLQKLLCFVKCPWGYMWVRKVARRILWEQSHHHMAQSGKHLGRAMCLLLLIRLALLVASWPAFEPLRNSSICLSLKPLRDET